MTIVPRWENNEKTIIYVQFSGDWSWEEFTPVRKTILEMIEAVPHIVDYIADFQDIDDIPTGALPIGRSIHKSCSRNEGVVLIVGLSPMLRMLYQSFTTAFPASKNEFIHVLTLDEAYQTIAELQENRNNQ